MGWRGWDSAWSAGAKYRTMMMSMVGACDWLVGWLVGCRGPWDSGGREAGFLGVVWLGVWGGGCCCCCCCCCWYRCWFWWRDGGRREGTGVDAPALCYLAASC